MAQPILLCTDGSEQALDALVAGLALLGPGHPYVLVTVADAPDPDVLSGTGHAGAEMTAEEFDLAVGRPTSRARQVLTEAEERLALDDLEVRVVAGEPGAAICALAAEVSRRRRGPRHPGPGRAHPGPARLGVRLRGPHRTLHRDRGPRRRLSRADRHPGTAVHTRPRPMRGAPMDVFPLIAAERLRLADALDALAPTSGRRRRCAAGWTVHVVAAHLNAPVGGVDARDAARRGPGPLPRGRLRPGGPPAGRPARPRRLCGRTARQRRLPLHAAGIGTRGPAQ